MKKNSLIFMCTLAAMAALSSCNDTAFSVADTSLTQNNPDVPPGLNAGSNAFNVPNVGNASKIDVLFVVDNSGSMAGEQATLAAGFSDFIRAFEAKSVDFHLGVITTDVRNTDANSWQSKLPGYLSPNRGDLLTRTAGQRFLTPAVGNLAATFSSLVNVGTRGDGSEQGLKSIVHALEPAKLAPGGTNADFIRDDALLSIVVVSDENECTAGFSADQRIDEVLARIGQIKGPNSPGYSFHFINSLNASKPNPVPASTQVINSCPGEWFYPTVYLRAADRTGSPTFDIARNFASDLGGIGDSIVTQGQSKFKLSAKPLEGTVTVRLGGVVIPQSAANGYVVDYAANTIELRGAILASSPGKQLVVEYLYQ